MEFLIHFFGIVVLDIFNNIIPYTDLLCTLYLFIFMDICSMKQGTILKAERRAGSGKDEFFLLHDDRFLPDLRIKRCNKQKLFSE